MIARHPVSQNRPSGCAPGKPLPLSPLYSFHNRSPRNLSVKSPRLVSCHFMVIVQANCRRAHFRSADRFACNCVPFATEIASRESRSVDKCVRTIKSDKEFDYCLKRLFITTADAKCLITIYFKRFSLHPFLRFLRLRTYISLILWKKKK